MEPKKPQTSWRTVALYSSLSLNLGFMIIGGYFLGRLLENSYHLKNMSITGILTGLFLGLYQMFLVASGVGKDKEKNKKK